MDQTSQYELQAGNKMIASRFSSLVANKRDEYLINYIVDNFSQSGSNLTIAELSIGDGSLSRALVSSLCNMKLICADISPSRIELLKDSFGPSDKTSTSEVNYIECNFDTQFDLLPTSNFDIVIALDIMEHVFDVFNFIENCNRILNNHGILFLRVPNIAYIRHRAGLFFGKLPITASWFETKGEITAWRERHGWDGGHLHYFTIPRLHELLNCFGFKVIKCRDPGCRFSILRNLIPRLLYSNPLIIAEKA